MIRPPPFRAEHIASLVRPPELLREREEHVAGKPGHGAPFATENAVIVRVGTLKGEAGLEVFADGEFRRDRYSDGFTSAGISGVKSKMTKEDGWSGSQSHGHRMA